MRLPKSVFKTPPFYLYSKNTCVQKFIGSRFLILPLEFLLTSYKNVVCQKAEFGDEIFIIDVKWGKED